MRKVNYSNVDNFALDPELANKRLRDDTQWVNMKGINSRVIRLSHEIEDYDPEQLNFNCFFSIYQKLDEQKTYSSGELLSLKSQTIEFGSLYRNKTRMRVFKTGIYTIFYKVIISSCEDESVVITMNVNDQSRMESQISIKENIESSKCFLVSLKADDYLTFSFNSNVTFDSNYTTFQCTGIKIQ